MAQTQDRPSYQYEPLPKEDHIRVLDLEPSTDRNAALCGKLRTVQLDHDDYPYEAISYTWGELVFSHMLHVTAANVLDESRVLYITSNLAELLQRMRYPLHPRTLWIDAICINQHNNEEKSNQIPMMMSIYRGAFQVNIWLGYHPGEEAMLSLLNVFSRKRTPTKGSSNTETETAREALCGILRLPWFTRRWIVQEAVVNPDVTVFCGSETMSLIRLFSLVHQLGSEYDPLFKPVRTMKVFWEKLTCGMTAPAEEKTREGPPIHETPCPMAELMEQFDHFDCGDPRDRIYALSSLQNCANITPDYGKTTEEVYIDFAVAMCLHGEWRWILNMASDRNKGSTATGLPSWVPDWRSRPLRKSMNTPLVRGNRVVNSECPESGERALTLEVQLGEAYNGTTVKRLSASISSKGEPFPSDQNKEHVQKWMKHISKFLLDNYPRPWLGLKSFPIQEILSNSVFEIFSAFQVAKAFPKPSWKLIESISWEDQNDMNFLEQVSVVMKGRCIFSCATTNFVLLGIGPSHLEIGDQLLLEHDVSRFFILRNSESTGMEQKAFRAPACPAYELVGNCAVKTLRLWPGSDDFHFAPSDTIMLK